MTPLVTITLPAEALERMVRLTTELATLTASIGRHRLIVTDLQAADRAAELALGLARAFMMLPRGEVHY